MKKALLVAVADPDVGQPRLEAQTLHARSPGFDDKPRHARRASRIAEQPTASRATTRKLNIPAGAPLHLDKANFNDPGSGRGNMGKGHPKGRCWRDATAGIEISGNGGTGEDAFVAGHDAGQCGDEEGQSRAAM